MKLIIGGAFQGKKEYAKQQFQISQEKMLDGAEASYEALFQCTCMFHFHEWIKRGLQENWNLEHLGERLALENPQVILITNELGYGVVPVDAFDRKYREAVGRVCTDLASKSKKVIRVVCGIGTVIKNA